MSGHPGIMRSNIKEETYVVPLSRAEYDAMLSLLHRAQMTTASSDPLAPLAYGIAYKAAYEQWLTLSPLSPQ